jgi:hypothetical protein
MERKYHQSLGPKFPENVVKNSEFNKLISLFFGLFATFNANSGIQINSTAEKQRKFLFF